MTVHNLTAAIDEALLEEMRRDERVFLMGTDPSAVLVAEFGQARARRMPIAEAAMTSMAVGAAVAGLRPVVNWRATTFSLLGFSDTINQAALTRYMTGGQCDMPIVFLTFYLNGTRSAAQHSQTVYALHAHSPGLKIVAPSTTADAKGLLKTAVRDDNPVLMFQALRLDGGMEAARQGRTIDDSVSLLVSDTNDECIPFGQAVTRREGNDVTIVAIAYMVELALEAAAVLAGEGIEVEIIDPRSLVPFDVDTVRRSVAKTGRLVVVDESYPTCSIAAEILSQVVEHRETFHSLRAPVHRVCNLPVPIPFSPALEDHVLPTVERVIGGVRSTMR